jgi:purine-nucleoside phosphorylase
VNGEPFPDAADAAEALASATGVARHDAAVVLGTGLAGAAEGLGSASATVAFSELPGFPPHVFAGQRPEVLSVPVAEKHVLVFLGRLHLYEGHAPHQVVHPVRTAVAAGCRSVLLTNASGAIRGDLEPGHMVLISDHLNLTGCSPLTGLRPTSGVAESGAASFDPDPFVDLTEAWSPRLRQLAREANGSLLEGVYAQVPGPQFETPAEIRMLHRLGADLVGMSTVLEAIAARHLGAELMGLSVVTNHAADIAVGPIAPGQIASKARGCAETLGKILREIVCRM